MSRPPGSLLLSIITPFFNSTGKADRLLATLARADAPDVEFIFVDDGSSDGTCAYLEEHRRRMRCPCTVVRQDENRGPGAGRNRGLAMAAGRYVWFVDSDDDINLEVIEVVRSLDLERYDFIDFELDRLEDAAGPVRPSPAARAGRLRLREGRYDPQQVSRVMLLDDMGWLVTKVYRRDFLLAAGLRFPEHCVYEDFLWFFWLPLVVNRFYKSSMIGYYQHQEDISITRSIGRKGPRFYDRLWTIPFCVTLTGTFECSREERAVIEDKFRKAFLFHTLRVLQSSGDWLMIPRVVKRYREAAAQLAIECDPFEGLSGIERFGLRGLWLLSYLYPSQEAFFQRLHLQAWGQPITYPPVRRPELVPENAAPVA
jgi:glycosyltransferase involved in cell wall biosynthesis